MSKYFRIKNIKILAGLFLLIFLYYPKVGKSQTSLFRVDFQIKANIDSQKFAKHYGIRIQKLFSDTFSSEVSQDELASMEKDPNVNYVEKDQKMSAALVSVSDPFFTTDDSEVDKQWYLPRIQLPQAWDFAKGSSNVVVAIVDTGIHASHVDLDDGRVIAGYNAITAQSIPAGADSDDNGHGTAVAGVIGAIPNNDKGIAGIDWNISLMPIKALDASGSGNVSAVAAGIVWAADHNANIINLSLGGNGFALDKTLSDAISYAYKKNVLIVAAAGNDLANQGTNLDQTPVYPVCADNGENMILGVAATDFNDKKAAFSNFGHNCVDISAPGERIITTAFLPSEASNNVLIYGSGTSLAAPIVSGVAALVKSTNFNLSNAQIQKILVDSADKIDALNPNNCLGNSCNGFLGSGRINALSALEPKPVADGSLIREASTGNTYVISKTNKQLISNFVFKQRGFDPNSVTPENNGLLGNFITINPLPPLDGTLIKSPDDPQVFVINQGLKRPVSFAVFISRKFDFGNINTLDKSETDSYAGGDWYWPPDGTALLIQGSPLVYVMDQQVRRPVSYFVFTQRGFSFSNIFQISLDEFLHYPSPADAYWLAPLNGTLIKSQASPAIYLIDNQTKRILSFAAFTSRDYIFSSVKILPQSEIDVIMPGADIN
jgi:hypothetical protein